MGRHEWRERTEEGETRLVRAVHHAGRWTLEARLKSEPAFVALDPIPLDDLHELRDVIARKYQRGRVPREQLLALDALIEEREAQGDG